MHVLTKKGIIDGYYKTFDLFGQQPIGREKHKEINSTNYHIYYKAMGATMLFVLSWIVLSLIGAMTSFMYHNIGLGYTFIGLYFAVNIPLYIGTFKVVYDRFKGDSK